MTVISHNISAMNVQRQLGINTYSKTKTAEKLSSGYRINRAADDAAGLQISEKMRYQIRGLDQGARNTQDGISFVQVADSAMNEIQSMLQRLNELAVQMSLEGVPNDLEIFLETGTDTYGGFVFHEERVPWTDINQNMIKSDANGNQIFVAGEYSYTSEKTGYTFEFRCKDGDTLPLITREISIDAK